MNDNLDKICSDILHCDSCELRYSATAPVCGFGQVGAKYFLLGEAPGAEEDEHGVPFIGAAGRKLDKLLELAGIDINDCYVSNVVHCRPPRNRDPRKKELAACVPFLMRELRVVKPTYLITLGTVPLKVFIPNAGVREYHGTLQEVEIPDE